MRVQGLLLVSVGLLAGCTAGLRVDNDDSRFFNPGPEARVVMLQDVNLQSRQLRVFFQDGIQVSQREVNPRFPNCNLELNTLDREARSVPPGTYAVTRTVRRHAHLAGVEPVLLAAIEPVALELAQRPGGSPAINFQTQFFLKPLQGGTDDIRALNCSRWADLGSIESYLTPAEIAQALGEIGRLEL
jgi:hypothetical protein